MTFNNIKNIEHTIECVVTEKDFNFVEVSKVSKT